MNQLGSSWTLTTWIALGESSPLDGWCQNPSFMIIQDMHETLHRSQKISQFFWKYYQQHAWPLYSVFDWIGPSELIEILSWLTQSGLPNWLHLFLRFILRAFEKRLEILKMHPSYLSHTSLLFWMPHLFTLWPLHTKKHLTVGWVM